VPWNSHNPNIANHPGPRFTKSTPVFSSQFLRKYSLVTKQSIGIEIPHHQFWQLVTQAIRIEDMEFYIQSNVVVKDPFLSNRNDHTAVALVERYPDSTSDQYPVDVCIFGWISKRHLDVCDPLSQRDEADLPKCSNTDKTRNIAAIWFKFWR